MEHVTMSPRASQKIIDANKTPKLPKKPTWSDMTAAEFIFVVAYIKSQALSLSKDAMDQHRTLSL
jgi:hypothetical protein